jgi:hypothetical protein
MTNYDSNTTYDGTEISGRTEKRWLHLAQQPIRNYTMKTVQVVVVVFVVMWYWWWWW